MKIDIKSTYAKALCVMILSVFVFGISASHAADVPKNVSWSTQINKISDTEGEIVWTATIAKGWHIYGNDMPENEGFDTNPTTITVADAKGLVLEGKPMPDRKAETHKDNNTGLDLPWWENSVTFTQKFKLEGVKGARINSTVAYMACDDTSCTPPTKETFEDTFGDVTGIPAADAAAETETEVTASKNMLWEPVNKGLAHDSSVPAENSSLWVIFCMGFLGGLLALLTPCVWPMIPMTVSFFLKTAKERRKAITNAITYGLSIIVIFLVLGIVITVIFGASKLNDIATSAIFNIIFFLMLVVFAISFFGAFDIKLPSKWSNAIDSKAETTSGVLSIFFMAFTLVLVSFSCTGPIIGTLLVEAASDGALIGPIMGMGGFALGLALPFGLFAIFPSFLQTMPKSGGWLNSVKVVLGFIELILSLKFLSVADLAYGWRILDREVFVAIWIVLFVLLGMYLLGKLRFSHDSESKHTSVLGFFMAVISFSFAVYLVPGLWGAPLKSISAFAPPLWTQDFNLYGGEVKEFDNYDEGMEYAKSVGKPAFVDFTGYGCVNCRKMEMAVFDRAEVRQIFENDFVIIRLYVDEKKQLEAPMTVEENGKKVKLTTVGEKWSYLQRHKFGINSQPYYVMLNDKGQMLAPSRAYDENVTKFVEWLELGKKNFAEGKTE